MGRDMLAVEGHGVLEALLVEDDDLDAQVLESFVDMNPHCAVRFTRAWTVSEAIRFARGRSYDMHFIDLRVAGSLSLRLLADLAHAGARPVVISSISSQEADRYRLNDGGLRFLPKADLSVARLSGLVREALRWRGEARDAVALRAFA